MLTSRGFVEWLAGERLGLVLSTYHGGGLLFLGRKPGNELGLHVSAFERAMGTWTDGQTLWVATTNILWRLENMLTPGRVQDGFDRVFVPRVGRVTGDLDVHDVAVGEDGNPVFVNTRFSCLATVDDRFSFRPLWKPPFVTALAPEDRCHLNGLAVEGGRPRYVTAVARTDAADAWRDHRAGGGVVMDVTTNEVVAEGLSMPHSPRLHGGRLWVLNSGAGQLGYVDLRGGKFEPVAFVPGYGRGLAFHGRYAVVGTSKPRRENAFRGLPLEQALAAKGAAPRCGLEVVETETGATVHWLRIESTLEELYDVAVLPGAVRPRALSFAGDAVAHRLCHEDNGTVQYWSAVPSPPAPRGPGG
jgi:uncharacterized protein (TIGR03032 family)